MIFIKTEFSAQGNGRKPNQKKSIGLPMPI
jgi:hypothetical protein